MSKTIESIKLEDVDRQRSDPLLLHFSTDIENVYRRENVDQHRKSVAINWLIGCFLFDIFLISDYYVAGDDFRYYIIGRIGFFTPICLVAIYASLKSDKYYDLLISFIAVSFSLTLSILLIISNGGSYRANYLFGDILLIICGYVISRPRVPYAIIVVVLQCILYGFVLQMSDIVDGKDKIVGTLFCLSGGVVTIMTAYALEPIGRRAFLLGLRVRLLNRELEKMARTDPLTGLGNRRLLDDEAERFWSMPSADTRLASLILIDIDLFKLFNDTYGHSAGDLCLTTIGNRIAGAVRQGIDIAVRFGGEEMVVFLPDADFSEARRIAEQIRLAILDARIPHPAVSMDAVVTASLGVATAPTTDCKLADLIIRADMALYAAKHKGRNQVWPPLSAIKDDETWTKASAASSLTDNTPYR